MGAMPFYVSTPFDQFGTDSEDARAAYLRHSGPCLNDLLPTYPNSRTPFNAFARNEYQDSMNICRSSQHCESIHIESRFRFYGIPLKVNISA